LPENTGFKPQRGEAFNGSLEPLDPKILKRIGGRGKVNPIEFKTGIPNGETNVNLTKISWPKRGYSKLTLTRLVPKKVTYQRP